MITSETPRPEPWMSFGKTPETGGWQVRGEEGRARTRGLKRKTNIQAQLLTRIMHELINGVKFVTVMARISVSLVLRFSFSGVIFFFF